MQHATFNYTSIPRTKMSLNKVGSDELHVTWLSSPFFFHHLICFLQPYACIINVHEVQRLIYIKHACHFIQIIALNVISFINESNECKIMIHLSKSSTWFVVVGHFYEIFTIFFQLSWLAVVGYFYDLISVFYRLLYSLIVKIYSVYHTLNPLVGIKIYCIRHLIHLLEWVNPIQITI